MKKAIILSMILVIFTGITLGQVPQLINYQGVLIDPSTGLPVPDGTYTIIFSIYDVASGGSPIWTESQSVSTKDGLYGVLLGSTTTLTTAILSGPEKYLGIKVGTDQEMTPRTRIVSVAYAILSEDADKLDGKDASDFIQAGQVNSISTDMLQNDAVTTAKISPNIVSSVDGVSNDGSDIDLVAGSNITITPDDVNNQITISAAGGGNGDITAVTAGNGLTGGGDTGDVTLDIGAGTGITVAADAIALNTTYTDGQYVNEGQANSISTSMITNDAVTSDKITADAVGSSEVADNSLTATDLAANSVNSSEVADNSLTATDLAVKVISSLDGVSNDGSDVDLVAGSNITITPDDVNNQITIAAAGGGNGDITAVTAGTGLTGGGETGDVTLDVGAGTGITVSTDAIALNTTFTDGQYVNEGQANSITNAMITDDAVTNDKIAANAVGSAEVADNSLTAADLADNSVDTSEVKNNSLTATDLAVNVISSLDGVSNDGGDIDLVEGSNITITPDNGNNRITISATGGGGGDITAVTAGTGLTGGGETGDVTLDVGAGTGITVSTDAIALNTTYTDAQYVNEEQANSIANLMITNDAVTGDKIAADAVGSSEVADNSLIASDLAVDVISSLDGVTNDGGNIDLVEGSNITITPNDGANIITISATGGGDSWSLTGNSGTTPETNFLGTTDDQALELHVYGARAFRLEPDAESPNVIGGYSGNIVTTGVKGAMIGGGGYHTNENEVTGDYGTVGGGHANVAGWDATVGGGFANDATSPYATVSGGQQNIASGGSATVAGGGYNAATGNDATVSGGSYNVASGARATVSGGYNNTAGGDHSFAAGSRAKANHEGSFVWADVTWADFVTTASNQFLIRASGGVGIGTNSPSNETQLHIRTAVDDNFGVLVDAMGTTGSEIGLHSAQSKYASLVKNAYYAPGWERFDTNSGAFLQQIGPGGDVLFRTAGAGTGPISWTNALTLTTSGNVGIGTTSPDANLAIEGVSDHWAAIKINQTGILSYAGLRLDRTDAEQWFIGMNDIDDKLIFRRTASSNDMVINDYGQVGIGTTTPHMAQLNVEFTGPSGYYAIYGKATPEDGVGTGGVFVGGATGSEGNVFPTGDGYYYAVKGLVYGGSGENYGVFGDARGSGFNVGVCGYAANGSDNYAGFFDGDVWVTGTLYNSSVTSKIDHPLVPEIKYLNHASVQSSDMMNVYSGNAILSINGDAWVELPEWFESLNKEFRYQLTCIGGFAPVYIAEKISNNRFKIAGGSPRMEVSWQVTGIRYDPFAEKHRIQVEEIKKSDDRGKYLHPEAYGLPENMGIDYERRQRMEQRRRRMKEER